MRVRKDGVLEDQPVTQTTSPWVVLGSVNVDNSLTGSFAITTSPVPISGTVVQDILAIPIDLIATTSGISAIVAAPGAGSHIRVKGFNMANNDAEIVDAGWRFGTGSIYFGGELAANGGARALNMVGMYASGASNTALNADLGSDSSVAYTIMYDIIQT